MRLWRKDLVVMVKSRLTSGIDAFSQWKKLRNGKDDFNVKRTNSEDCFGTLVVQGIIESHLTHLHRKSYLVSKTPVFLSITGREVFQFFRNGSIPSYSNICLFFNQRKMDLSNARLFDRNRCRGCGGISHITDFPELKENIANRWKTVKSSIQSISASSTRKRRMLHQSRSETIRH